MSNGRKAVKAGIGYTLGNIFIKGINFLTLPFFSRLMTTEEFGIFNVFTSYEAIIYVIVGLAIHSSIRSANLEFKGKIKDYISSVSIIYIINAGIMFVIALIFGSHIQRFSGFSVAVLIMLIMYSFGSALLAVYNEYVSLEYSYKKYLFVALGNSLGNISLSLLLMLTLFRQHKDVGRILGVTVAITIVSLYILYVFYKGARPKVKKHYWIFALKYSLPIVPHGISQVLLAQFDRIMIGKIVGNAEAGVYSLAGNIKLILTILTTSISAAWSTWFYEEIEKNEKESIQHRARQLCELFLVFTIGILSISPELIYVLGGNEYNSAKYVAIPMVLDAYFLFIYNVIVVAEYYKKKTAFIMLGTMGAAVINVITNYIFISKYGFIAAAYTTLFSYSCYLALHLIISHKVLGFPVLKYRWLILFLILSSGVSIVDLLAVDSIILRWGVCLVAVVLLGLHLYCEIKKERGVKNDNIQKSVV